MFEADESGWPANRIWFGVGAILYTLFDATIGRQLPGLVLLLVFGLAVASLLSAFSSLNEVRLRMQLALTREAIAEAQSSAHDR